MLKEAVSELTQENYTRIGKCA